MRAVESMQASLEVEARGKADAFRSKKKFEQDINELEVSLDGANRGRAEAEKNIKKYQNQLRETQQALEDEHKNTSDARDQYQAAERRANVAVGEVEEIRAALEVSERSRKMAESEAHEAHDRVSELVSSNASLGATKRKLETDMEVLRTDLEDLHAELRGAEEHAKKAMSDAARLAEQLRQEQDHAGSLDKSCNSLETLARDIQARLDEAEANVLKGGKRMIQKLEAKVRLFSIKRYFP